MASGTTVARTIGRGALKALKWLGIFVFGLVSFVLVVVGVALVLLQTDWGRGVALSMVLDQVNPMFEGEIRVGRLEGSIVSTLVLVDVDVLDPEGDLVAHADRIEAAYDLTTLVDQRVEVVEAVVRGLSVAVTDAKGRVGIARAFQPTEPSPPQPDTGPSPWVVVVSHAAIVDSRVVQSPAEDAPTLEDLDVDVAIRFEQGVVSWDQLQLSARPVNVPPETLTLATSGSFGPERMVLDTLQLEAGPNVVRAQGQVRNLGEAPVVDLEIDRVHVDLGMVVQAVPTLPVRGEVSLDGWVRGPLARLTLDLEVHSSGGSLALTGMVGLPEQGGPVYDLVLSGRDIQPSGILTTFDSPLVADLNVRAKGEGDPLKEGHAAARIELSRMEGVPPLPLPLVVQATVVKGDVQAVVRAEGGPAERVVVSADGTVAEGLITADVKLDVRGVHVPALAALAGIDGARGELSRLTGTASVRLPEGKKPKVIADIQLEAAGLHLPEGAGLEADVAFVEARADVTWPGEGLPAGDIYLNVKDAAAAGAKVGGLEVDAELARVGVQGVRAEGRLEAQDLKYLDQASVQVVEAPFAVTWPGGEGAVPTGSADLTVKVARFEDTRIDQAKLDLTLDQQGDALAVSGPVTIDGFAQGRDVALGKLTGRIEAVRQPSGRIAGDVDLVATRIAAADNRVARAQIDATGSFVPGPKPRIDARGTLSVQGVQAGKDASVARASGTFDVKLRGGEPTGTVDLQASGVSLPQRELDTVELTARLDKGGKARVQAEAEGGGSRVELDVSGDLPTGRDKTIAATVNTLRLEGPAGGLELEPGAKLRWAPGEGIDVDGLSLRGTGELPGRLLVDVDVDEKTGEIAGEIRIEGLPVGRWLTTVSRIVGVEILPDTEVAGVVDMTASLGGTLREPRGSVALTLANARYGALQGLDADLRASLEPKRARIAGVMTWTGDSRVRLDVTVPADLRFGPFAYELVPDGELSVHVGVSSVDLADLQPFAPDPAGGEPLAGALKARIDIDGTPARPLGILEIEANDVSYGPMEETAAEVVVRLDEARTVGSVGVAEVGKKLLGIDMDVPANLVATFVGPRPMQTLRERLDQEPAKLALHVNDIRLGKIPFTSGLSAGLQNAVVGSDIRIEGTLDTPQIDGEVHVTDVPVAQALARAQVRFETVGDDIRATLSAATLHEQLLEGYVNVPRGASRLLSGENPKLILLDEGLVVNVVSSPLTAQTIADIAPDVGLLIANAVYDPSVTFSLSLEGGEAGPTAQMVAQVQAVGARLPNRQQAIAHSITVSAEALPDRLAASVIADQGGERGFLTIRAEADVGTDALVVKGQMPEQVPIQGFANTRSFDLNGLSRLYPMVFGPSEGMLTVDMTLDGTLQEPQLAGAIEMYFEELVLAVLGTKHENTKLRLELQGEQLHLEPIHWEQGGGTMDVTFDMVIPALDPQAIEVTGQVKMDDYRLVDRSEARASLTGQVDVAGTAAEPVVSGSITVNEAEINPMLGGRNVRPIGPPEDVVFGRAGEDDPASPQPTDEVKTGATGPVVSLSVEIPPRNVWVHSDMLNVFAEGALRVEMFGGVTSIEGMITVVEGTVELYGRQFSIAPDSHIVFAGGTELNPRLSITATYDISAVDLSPIGLTTDDDSRIYVEVKGRADAPELVLRSDPPMDDTNIVSVIVLGSPMGGGVGSEQAVEQQTLNLFVGLATGTITKLVQSELPVDVFKVEGGEESLADAQITVGKRITRDLLVMYQANLGSEVDENTNEVLVDYSILQNLHMETRFGDAGQGAINLYYRWRY